MPAATRPARPVARRRPKATRPRPHNMRKRLRASRPPRLRDELKRALPHRAPAADGLRRPVSLLAESAWVVLRQGRFGMAAKLMPHCRLQAQRKATLAARGKACAEGGA